MKPATTLLTGALVFILSASFVLDGKDTSNLEKKVYKITITEQKKGKSGKAEEDEAKFSSGKFQSDFFGKNAGAKQIPIELDKDSTYTEEGSDEELIYAEFSGEMTNNQKETVKLSGTVDGYGIEGNVEIVVKEKVKKHWDFVGTQKDKKKKK
jgi:hypothetical protein